MAIHFESKDLYMKNLTMDDFAGFFELQSDPDVMKYTGKSLLKQSETECLQYFQTIIEHQNGSEVYYRFWGVFEKISNDFIGTGS